jgi:hypothetical protein
MTDPNPRGVRVIHPMPGDHIEIAMWWVEKPERVSCFLTDKQAMALLADLATALRKNNVVFGSDQPRRPDAGRENGD